MIIYLDVHKDIQLNVHQNGHLNVHRIVVTHRRTRLISIVSNPIKVVVVVVVIVVVVVVFVQKS